MTTRQNRTIICSVLFLDIVEYSRRPVAEQIRLRERFNALLSEALQSVAPNDRVILDTGDGAAVSFLGDPEDALFMALTLRDALADERPETDPALSMRFGINLGPVKLVKDLNGQSNILGDGINVAQRIMSFAQPGQVLVSRSYYEVVSRLSDEYSRLFHYEGPRTDKHVREHEIYAVDADSSALRKPATAYRVRGFGKHGRRAAIGKWITATTTIWGNVRLRPRFVTALMVAAILASAVGMRADRESPPVMVAGLSQTVIQTAGLPAKTVVPPIDTTQTVAELPIMLEKLEPPAAGTPQAVRAVSVTRKRSQTESSTVSLAISPWGEVYVDGKKRGVSPPLRKIQVAPGKHKIEIRNTVFPSRIETINAKTESEITVRHKFAEAE